MNERVQAEDERVEQVEEAEPKESVLDRILAEAGTFQERAYAFKQLAESRQRSIIGAAAVGLSSTSWGKDLSIPARKAVARYALELGTDPLRHWEVLGNKLYDTAELWMDVAAAHPQYDGFDPPEYLNDDERLEETENARRRAARARWCMPDAPAVCLVTLYRKDKSRPFIAANHAGEYKVIKSRTGKEGVHDDPIGGENPGKTAFTRAFRKAAKTAFPLWFASHQLPTENGLSIDELKREPESLIRAEREEVKAQEAELGPEEPQPIQIQPGLAVKAGQAAATRPVHTPDDPYGDAA